MERWREGSEDPEVWSMEDRRLVEFYRLTIRENGMVVLSQRELMKERDLRTRVVNYKHCHGEMYRQARMMEEREECLREHAFEGTDYDFEVNRR